MNRPLQRRDFLKAAGLGAFAAAPALGADSAAAPAPKEQLPLPEPRLRTGPYLQNPAPDAMTILWMTSVPCYGYVEYGPTEALGQRADADTGGLRQANNLLHRVRPTGLKPGSQYYYRVRCQPITTFKPYQIAFAPDIESSIHQFKTPDPASRKVRFLIFNDLHDNVALWKSLYALVANEPVDFVFLNGDVTDYLQDEKQMVEYFLDVCTGTFASSTPFLYARGNHETRGAYARQMMQHLDLLDGRYYYAVSWGPIRLVVLDSGEDKPDSAPVYAGLCSFDSYRDTQTRWLENEVVSDAFKSAKYRVVIHHIPAQYNFKADDHPENHGAMDVRAKWWPIFNREKVDLYIGGHTHKATIKPADPGNGHVFPVMIGGGPRKGIGTVMLAEFDQTGFKVKMLADNGKLIGEVPQA